MTKVKTFDEVILLLIRAYSYGNLGTFGRGPRVLDLLGGLRPIRPIRLGRLYRPYRFGLRASVALAGVSFDQTFHVARLSVPP